MDQRSKKRDLLRTIGAAARVQLMVLPEDGEGVEVHEPRLEGRPRHRLQHLADAPIHLDLVVQRAGDVGYRALFLSLDRQPRRNFVFTFTAENVTIALPPAEEAQKRAYHDALRRLLRPERRHILPD